jgi:hypothetical protein
MNMVLGKSKLNTVEALEKTSLEYTLFYVGYFLDVRGSPHAKSYQRQNIIAVDIEYKRTAMPGTGNAPVTFTRTLDIAEYVAASLDFPKWELESCVIGDVVTWNEFLSISEETIGTE